MKFKTEAGRTYEFDWSHYDDGQQTDTLWIDVRYTDEYGDHRWELVPLEPEAVEKLLEFLQSTW